MTAWPGLRRILDRVVTPDPRDRAPAPPVPDVGYAKRLLAAAKLKQQFEHWTIFAGRAGGFWAGTTEAHTPIGCVPTITADTADGLAAQLEEQERLRGRRPK